MTNRKWITNARENKKQLLLIFITSSSSFISLLLDNVLLYFLWQKRIYIVDDSLPIAQHVIYQTNHRHRSIIRRFFTSWHYFIFIYLIQLIRLLSFISNFFLLLLLTFSFLIKITNRQSSDLNIYKFIIYWCVKIELE